MDPKIQLFGRIPRVMVALSCYFTIPLCSDSHFGLPVFRAALAVLLSFLGCCWSFRSLWSGPQMNLAVLPARMSPTLIIYSLLILLRYLLLSLTIHSYGMGSAPAPVLDQPGGR